MRSFVSASAQGCIGSSPGLKSAAMLTRYFALAVPQMPERSGLPSALRGAGAARFGLPSRVRGVPLPGTCNHCAAMAEHRTKISSTGLSMQAITSQAGQAVSPVELLLVIRVERDARIGGELLVVTELDYVPAAIAP